MLEGVLDHVGGWFGIVMEMFAPTVIAGEPLSVAVIRRLQVPAGVGAVKLMLQYCGEAPPPVTAGVNPNGVQLVPPLEQLSV